jgi:hypothetical protein
VALADESIPLQQIVYDVLLQLEEAPPKKSADPALLKSGFSLPLAQSTV